MRKSPVFVGLIFGVAALLVSCSSSQSPALSVRVVGRLSYVGEVRPTAFITAQNTSSIALTNVVLTVTCTEQSTGRATQFRGTISAWGAGVVDVFTLNYNSGSETLSTPAPCVANITAGDRLVTVTWQE